MYREEVLDQVDGDFEIREDGQVTLSGRYADEFKAFLVAIDRANWRVGDLDHLTASKMKSHQEALAWHEAQQAALLEETGNQ